MATPTPLPRYERILTGHERRQRGRCWRPEGTDDWLLIHTLAGRAHVMLPDGQLSLGAGETLLFRPSAPQDFGGDAASGLWELAWVHFLPLPHWLELLRWPEIAPGILRMAVSEPSLRERIETRLLEADRLSGSGLRYADRLAQNALESALLWWEVQNPARRPLDPRVVEAIDYLSRSLDRRVPIAELARAVHLSASRLAHLFRAETGLSPRRFAERQRLERAKQLLELTSLPVNAVAREAGFESQFHFATRFRASTGTTPSAYRAARRSDLLCEPASRPVQGAALAARERRAN